MTRTTVASASETCTSEWTVRSRDATGTPEHLTVDRPAGRDASTCVAMMVAAVRGVEATDLQPLGTVVDPEAIDRLVARSDDDADLAVEFTYADCQVLVRGDGHLSVRRGD